MQNDSNLTHEPWQKLIIFLNFFLNPNNFLIRNNQIGKQFDEGFDLRSSPTFRIVGRKIIYFFRTLFLIFIDNSAVVISWILVKILNNLFVENSLIIEIDGFRGDRVLNAIVILNLLIFLAAGLYSTKDRSRRLRDVVPACSITYGTFLVSLWAFLGVNINSQSLILCLALLWLINLFVVCSERFVVFETITFIRNYFLPLRRKVLLVGVTKDIKHCQFVFAETKSFDIVETLDLYSYNNDGYFEDIYQQVLEQNLDEVFICSWEEIKHQTKLFWNLQTSGISWRIIPIKQPIPSQPSELADIEGIPTIRYTSPTIVGIDFLLKRIFDLVVATSLLIVLGIPMLLIGLLIKLDSPGSVLYKQTRVGLKGRQFEVWKFRTMVENASQLQKQLEAKNEVSGGILFKISDDPRITFVGKYLRRYSLDELPQLFNVLLGEMSLVGPRPLPIRDVDKFSEHHHFRHEVLPGITGLWQVSGRSDTNSDKVFTLDFRYIQNWSLAFDIKILLKTVQVVLFGKGAY
ncbi:Sugar transferase [Hyella patelloides LEGE 07179]|uniref:Sugar transferase n=1 Tax=Hyella patelloides LEGE 07179 TaxID=945734 RepID=A0A563VS95_9CYAN|nr:sugar transferase [Hyella patelloides]VEP14283.1 Sugar transferase [Hyella patelloides LEGE 07179]